MIKKICIACIFSVMVFLLTMNSCKHEPIAPPTHSDEICFQWEVLPIIQSNCAKSGCHDAEGEEGVILTDYNNIVNEVSPGNPSGSNLYEVLIASPNSEKHMPPSPNAPLTTEQQALIYNWIAQGAKNTTCPSTCDTNVFTFSGAVWPTMQLFCKGCHSGTAPSGNLSLQNYSEVVSAVDSRNLYGRITSASSPMPPSGLMDDCKIRQIKKWIDAGKLNN